MVATIRKILLALLGVYQRIFSLLSHGSCRYYPTCSEYARWRIEKDSLGFALVTTVLRILRCNQLFPGGIDYPVVHKRFSDVAYKKIDVRYWYVPKGKNRYYLIKSFTKVQDV